MAMPHIADDELLAYLDDELADERRSAIGRHLEECAACADALEALRSTSEQFSRALERIDRPAPTVEFSSILSRSESRGKRRLERAVMAKAAVLLLTVAGASAAAIPGSPVREWLGRSLAAVGEFLASGPEEPGSTLAPVAEPGPGSGVTGVAVTPVGGQVRISLTEPAPDAVVRVTLVESRQATVWSADARYRTGAGWIEVLGSGPGELRIELPRWLRSARIDVNGQVIVIKEDAALRLLTAPDSSGSEVVFRVGG